MRRACDASSGGERGFVVVELVAGLALLVLPVALLVLMLPVWAERQSVARVAARAAGRVVARSGRCDTAAARESARIVAANHGVSARDLQVDLDCATGAVLAPGGSVVVAVTIVEPAVAVPAIGDVGDWSFTARHAEPVDRYAGVP